MITMLELGGAQGNTLYTVSHLDRNRFEPHLICGRGGMLDPEASSLELASLTFCDSLVREIRPVKDFQAYRELTSLLQKMKPHIVHTHSSKAGVIGRLAAAAAGVPVVIHTYHGFGFHRYQNPLWFQGYLQAERMACKRTHHLIFVSRDNWNWAKKLGLTARCSASLIHSGIPVERILSTPRKEELRLEIGVPPDAKLAGMIACLKPQKDPVTYVRSAARVLQKSPPHHFLLAGDGELRDAVLREAAALPPGHFHFLGWRRDVYEILKVLDLLVLTSLWEGLPRVIPEAIVSRVPVVASNIDGNREILQATGAGLLAEPRGAEDFSEKILMALSGDVRVDDLSAQYVRREFDIDDMIDAQERLYLELMERS